MNDLSITIPRDAIRQIVREELEAMKASEEKPREMKKHMRIGKYACYPQIRKNFESFEELGSVINKGSGAVQNRMKGLVPFTEREKELILRYLELEVNAVNKRKIFDIGRKEKAA
jgi:hypothetical protein